MRNLMVIDQLNTKDVVFIHRVDEGENHLLLEVLCDTTKNPTITFDNGTVVTPTSNDYTYEIPSSVWAGSGTFTFTVADTTGSKTFTIMKATNDNINISLQLNNDGTYSLGTYVNLLDISENTVDTITDQTTEYPEILAGNKMSTIIGKIKKFLSDLKSKKQDANTAITTSNIANQSVKYATSAGTATDNAKLPLAGGTLTGNVTMLKRVPTFFMTESGFRLNTSPNNGLSADGVIGIYYYTGSDGQWTGRMMNYAQTNGNVYNQIAARNMKTDGTYVTNYLTVGVAKDGTPYYSMPNPANFRSAISAAPASHTHNYLPISNPKATGALEVGSTSANGTIELYHTTPFIDFHRERTSRDYTVRMIADTGTTLRFPAMQVSDGTATYATLGALDFVKVSSRLLKKNIRALTEDEAYKLLKLAPVKFDFINDAKGQYGLIAEEVMEVYPYCVYVPDDYDEEKTKQQIENNESADTLGIDYSKLIAPLIKMVQIQQKQIDELKELIKGGK